MNRGVFLLLLLVVLLGVAFFFLQEESADEFELLNDSPREETESSLVLPERPAMDKEEGVKEKPHVASDPFARSCPLRVLSSDGRVLHDWQAWVKVKEGDGAKLVEEGSSLSLSHLNCAVLVSGRSIWPEETTLSLSQDEATVDVQLKNGKRLAWPIKFDGILDPEPQLAFRGRERAFDWTTWRIPTNRSWRKVDLAFDPDSKMAILENYSTAMEGDILVKHPYHFDLKRKAGKNPSHWTPWNTKMIRWDPTDPVAELALKKSIYITARAVNPEGDFVTGVSLRFLAKDGIRTRSISDGNGLLRFDIPESRVREASISWFRGPIWRSRGPIEETLHIGSIELPDIMRIIVTVRDSQGMPIAGAGAVVRQRVGSQRSDLEGVLDMGAVPCGTKSILVGALGHQPQAIDIPPGPSPIHLTAILEKAPVIVVGLAGPQTILAQDAFLLVSGDHIRDDSKYPVWRTSRLDENLGASLNPSALSENEDTESLLKRRLGETEFFVSSLKPGAPVSLQLVSDGFFRFPLSDVVQVDVPLEGKKKVVMAVSKQPKSITIRGRIIDSNGRPVDGARAGLRIEGSQSLLSVFANSQGFFCIRNVPMDGFLLRGIFGNRVSQPVGPEHIDSDGLLPQLILPDE